MDLLSLFLLIVKGGVCMLFGWILVFIDGFILLLITVTPHDCDPPEEG